MEVNMQFIKNLAKATVLLISTSVVFAVSITQSREIVPEKKFVGISAITTITAERNNSTLR